VAGTSVIVPPERDSGHVYHLFPVLVPERDAFRSHLEARGVGTLVHYPIPIPDQAAFDHANAGCPVARRVCDEECSLPLHPSLSDADADFVAAEVRAWRPSAGPGR
jgi:dTDP-4-amino-4,6-dideoxygalactose transaminase